MSKKKVFAGQNPKKIGPSLPLKTMKKKNQVFLSRQFCASPNNEREYLLVGSLLYS
jgi:hypothetical protein